MLDLQRSVLYVVHIAAVLRGLLLNYGCFNRHSNGLCGVSKSQGASQMPVALKWTAKGPDFHLNQAST